MDITLYRKKSVNGIIDVPGDKSISHRAVMLGAIAKGTTEITGFLNGDDCLATISCFKKLGVDIETDGDAVKVFGNGLHGLKEPSGVLDVGNSGTAIRLMTGLLAAQNFSSEITGDDSIRSRPMGRVIEPLTKMGADISSNERGLAPLSINGKKLDSIEYTLPVASAQVKSAILLASLYAKGPTTIIEPAVSRNHTEIMLNYLGADIKQGLKGITSNPIEQLYAKPIFVPGDISSAAFFIVAGIICPNSHIIITNVGVNATRTGIIYALREMGANVDIINRRKQCGEALADIEVKSGPLRAITLSGSIIPKMIDEIPVFAVAALFAKGTTVIKDAKELKVKESNRIAVMVSELKKLGADIEELDDGMVINGGVPLHGANVNSHNDHRVAMSLAVAALNADGETTVTDAECVGISFPNFFEMLQKIGDD